MLAQAAGLAVLAAVSPTALLVVAVFLGSASPRRMALVYMSGAIAMTVIMAIVVFAVLRAGHVQLPGRRTPRYGVRLGLGVLMLLAGLYLRRRGPRPPDPGKPGRGLLSRLLARPGPRTAFAVGIVVATPSLAFVSAVQIVATAQVSTLMVVAGIALVIVISLVLVWLPIVLHVLAPDRTNYLLKTFNGWLRSHGYAISVGALLLGGVVLTANGILGVAGVIG